MPEKRVPVDEAQTLDTKLLPYKGGGVKLECSLYKATHTCTRVEIQLVTSSEGRAWRKAAVTSTQKTHAELDAFRR